MTGIPAQLIRATAKPIASGAKPCGARLSVAPRMIRRKKKAKHRFGAEAGQQGIAARGVVAVAVGGEAAGDEAGPPGGDEIEHPGAEDPADHLGGNVAGDLVRGEPLAEHEAHGDGGVDMAARDMAQGVDHRDHGQPEGERDPEDPNAELRNSRRSGARSRSRRTPTRTCRALLLPVDCIMVASPEGVVLPRTMPVGSQKCKPPDALGR